MINYKLLILMTAHESPDCVKDNIENILKFNPNNTGIIISNDCIQDINYLARNNVHIINRQSKWWGDAAIPYHLEMHDYMLSKNISADYVIMMSSNQLFLRTGLYDFVKKFAAGYWERHYPFGIEPLCRCLDNLCDDFIKDLKEENLQNLSNLDGMFYRFDIFLNMFEYFAPYRNRKCANMLEERFYAGYLLKNIPREQLAEFSQYNYFLFWDHSVDSVKEAIEKEMYMIKKISRKYDDPAREYIRSLPVQ